MGARKLTDGAADGSNIHVQARSELLRTGSERGRRCKHAVRGPGACSPGKV